MRFLFVTLLMSFRPWMSVGSKKDRHGGEVLTLMLQALQSIVTSEALPADKVLVRQRFKTIKSDALSFMYLTH